MSTFDKQFIENGNNKESDPYEKVNIYRLTPSLVQAMQPVSMAGRNNKQLEKSVKSYKYRIGVGDILNITVWSHPELTIPAGSYRSPADAGNLVHADGTIFYPHIGRVLVQGKTVTEVRLMVTKQLAKYIESPQVDVNIAAFRSQRIYISGEVVKPGTQYITNVPLTLLDSFNEAGGLTDDADWNNAVLVRGGKEYPISLQALIQYGDLQQNLLMQAGDIIYIPRNDEQKVFVMGEVHKQAVLKIDRGGMTLTEALAKAEGINQQIADAKGIFIIRPTEKNSNNKPTIYQLDLSDATAYAMGTAFYLQPYDVIYVTAAPIARWNRLIQQLLPTVYSFNELSEGVHRIRRW